jgi:hypothetical protein
MKNRFFYDFIQLFYKRSLSLACIFFTFNVILPIEVLSLPCAVTYASYPTMPQATVNVVFHFLHDPRPGKTDFTQSQAEDLAAILILNANTNFANMQICNKLGINNIPAPLAEGEDNDNSGYAKSLLSLLEGMRFVASPIGFSNSDAVQIRSSSTNSMKVERSITISPNPANQKLIIEIPEYQNIHKIIFYDINGIVLKTLTTTSLFLETDLADCPNGLYIVKFLDADNIVKYTTKLFVNK